MKYRKTKPDDQENAEKVFKLIGELFELNPWIEPNIMISALMSTIANNYRVNDFSYEDYTQEIIDMMKFYKIYWEEE